MSGERSSGHKIEVAGQDIVRLILQYLAESSLHASFKALSRETGVDLNVLDNQPLFRQNVLSGNWDVVLERIQLLRLSQSTLAGLYTQVFLELVELKEYGAARVLLKNNASLQAMERLHPKLYRELEHLLASPAYDILQYYHNNHPPPTLSSLEEYKQQCRDRVATSIINEIAQVPSSRLLLLLNRGLATVDHESSIFGPLRSLSLPEPHVADIPKALNEASDRVLIVPTDKIFSNKGRATKTEVLGFMHPTLFINGTSDGFLEVYHDTTLKLDRSLPYQKTNDFIIMPAAITALCLDGPAAGQTSKAAALGDRDGHVCLFDLETGSLVVDFARPHASAVTSVLYLREASKVITASIDGTIQIHGMAHAQTPKRLDVLSLHSAQPVNTVSIDRGQTHLVSGGADGSVVLYDLAKRTPIRSLDFSSETARITPITHILTNDLLVDADGKSQFLVSNRTRTLRLITRTGDTVCAFQLPDSAPHADAVFTQVALSHRASLAYAVADGNYLCVFNLKPPEPDSACVHHGPLHAALNEAISLAISPDDRLLAVSDITGKVYFYAPQKIC